MYSRNSTVTLAAEGILRAVRARLVLQFWMCGPLGTSSTLLGLFDLIPLRFGGLRAAVLRRRLAVLRDREDVHVITLAETTRSRLACDHGLDPYRIHVLRPGADHISDDGLARWEESTRGDYFLVVGRLRPHKGLDRVVQAWALGPRTRALVLVLPPADTRSARAQEWQRLGVEVLCNLDAHELARLQRGATAVVCPSYEEGYDLPLAEAVTVGSRVIASDIPAHRELGVSSISWVPAESPDAWGDALATYAATAERASWVGEPPTWRDWRRRVAELVGLLREDRRATP